MINDAARRELAYRVEEIRRAGTLFLRSLWSHP